MNALIDLKNCRELMTVTLGGRDQNITMENPYFCGKDVCGILDHKNSKYALQTHVPLKYKKDLSYFYGENIPNEVLDVADCEIFNDISPENNSPQGCSPTETFGPKQWSSGPLFELGLWPKRKDHNPTFDPKGQTACSCACNCTCLSGCIEVCKCLCSHCGISLLNLPDG